MAVTWGNLMFRFVRKRRNQLERTANDLRGNQEDSMSLDCREESVLKRQSDHLLHAAFWSGEMRSES